MLKPVATLAAVGIVGFLLFPLLGMFLGFLFTVLKIVLIVALIWFGFSLFRKWTDRPSEA